MCGIAGILGQSTETIPSHYLKHMLARLHHRGPDDEGIWVNGNIGLGHRRLSIIDLSKNGRNPMFNEDGTLALVFNGEIYNYKPLKSELIQKGHIFSSSTDTEVVLHLYEERGPACVSELNGMFAFALWDSRNQRLFLARDRFGVKPLYYSRIGNWWVFASEVKAFVDLPGFTVEPDPQALTEHFTAQNTVGERTWFKGVSLLPQGHTYLIEPNGKNSCRSYWDLSFEPDNTKSLREWIDGLRQRFEVAVTRQLMSDVPLGTYLSGGMDTGSISAVAVRHIPKMHTFTCGFTVPGSAYELERYFDESADSYRLADLLKTQHHDIKIESNVLQQLLPKVVWHLDEPRVGISYQVYATAELVRRFVTVVLSGVGGDELFAGYPWRYEALLQTTNSNFENECYQMWCRLMSEKEIKSFFSPTFLKQIGGFSPRDSFNEIFDQSRFFDRMNRLLYLDFKIFLNGLLIVDDKLSMAHSIETRVPFLDNDLVDFVSKMPSELKYNGEKGKMILREAMKGLLPDETLQRRKQGFTPPDQSWYSKESLIYVKDLILGERARKRDYFDQKEIECILEQHLKGLKNHRFLLWSLMCFEWWNRIFIDHEIFF